MLTWNDIRKEGGYGPRVNGQTSCSWFHLGACIALEYGLDYPDGVKALVLMTVAMRPKERPRSALELWLNAAQDAEINRQWLELSRVGGSGLLICTILVAN